MSAVELIEPAEPKPATVVALRQGGAITPAELMRAALDRQGELDLDRMERLLNMQTQWEQREAAKAFNAAFASFKAEAVHIVKNRQVTDGPLKGKRYAELFAVVNAITPALSKHGLSASWKLTKDDKDWLEVTCTLKHALGHSESVSMGGPPDTGGAKNAIQARASTISYLERYTLKAITGLSEQDDDNDGNSGGGQDGEVSAELQALIDAGHAQAMEGNAALTRWWGALSKQTRTSLTPHFAAMKKAAEQADRDQRR